MPILDLRGGSVHLDHLDFGRSNFIRRAGLVLEIVSNDVIITLPTSALTLATLTGTETLTNKTLDLASNTLVATSAQIAAAVTNETGSGLLVFATSPTLTTPVIGAATGTSLSLTGALAGGTSVTVGTGFDGAETEDSGVWTCGSIIYTWYLVDLTGLNSGGADLDIIGENPAVANCHFGQFTTAVNGVFTGGLMTCLEAPAGGTNDVDLYSANESTGAEDALITGLTETALVTSGAAWTAGRALGFTGAIPANDYLYFVSGAIGDATYTAGKFLIEIWGT